jgi:hypothetical protein
MKTPAVLDAANIDPAAAARSRSPLRLPGLHLEGLWRSDYRYPASAASVKRASFASLQDLQLSL